MALGRGVQELASASAGAKAIACRTRPAIPSGVEIGGHRREVALVVDVELEHVGRLRQPGRGALGHAARSPEAGEHDLGAGALRLLGDGEGDALAGDHPGEQQALALEQRRRGH